MSQEGGDLFDALVLGQRLRSARRRAGLTLGQLGALVGRPASYLSQVENGRREPRLTTVGDLAAALGCTVGELLDGSPPDRRSALELRVVRMQEDARYRALRLPAIRPSARTDDATLQHLVALFDRVVELTERLQQTPRVGTGARTANAAMREEMRGSSNYFPDIEAVASSAAAAVGSDAAVVSERVLGDLAAHFGFSIARVQDLPPSTRSISDLRGRVIYVSQRNDLPTRAARSVVAQTLGHFALGHRDPVDFEEYVRQRVEANYFAGALLAPERVALPLLERARADGELSAEDLRDVFYISYEMAAHRMTNLLTHHLSIPVHFLRSDPEGFLWKAYENDGVPLPADEDGTIEGQRLCRAWGARRAFESEDVFRIHFQHTETPAGRFWCMTNVETDGTTVDAVTLGTPAEHARHFRGHETTAEAVSTCPDPSCCSRPRPGLSRRWSGLAWASARDRSHFVSGLPTDAASFNPFPGVDLVDVYEFLDRHRAG
ncbi:MAG: helix-turn-helix domain-containing protein [Actinomycetota bacterium]|nr:helix-turn-helix domain-containing protein [Actinomycetota bacterium]